LFQIQFDAPDIVVSVPDIVPVPLVSFVFVGRKQVPCIVESHLDRWVVLVIVRLSDISTESLV
jgi:hypothetical protein